MVQIKVSSLLLAAVIAGYTQTLVVARKYSVRDLEEYQVYNRELHEKIIRAVVEEVLVRRSFDESSELWTREFEDVEERSPEPVTNFFKGIGQFVKRMFSDYWKDMKNDVAILDFRKRRSRRKDHIVARRYNLEARSGTEDMHPYRRRFAGGRMVARNHNGDDFHGRRRRFSNGHMDSSTIKDPQGVTVPHATYRQRRHRFENGQIARGYDVEDSGELLTRTEEPELIPRMSWFGKALLIYRDVNGVQSSPQLKRRSDPVCNERLVYRAILDHLSERDTVDDTDYELRSLYDLD